MSWNTKRDGYYSSSYDRNSLGSPVERLQPLTGHTHVITIPGTTFKMFLSEKADSSKLLKQLAKTTVKGIGKKRVKAAPILHTIEEFHALHNSVKAA